MAVPAAASLSTWPARFSRWLGCDRNPLRRASDRIEARLVFLAAISYLPLAMLAASYVSHWVYEAGVRAQHVVHARPVTAVVLTAAEWSNPVAPVRVPVRWTIDGQAHTGAVPVPYGTSGGAIVRVWVDRSGNVTTPPPPTSQLEGQVLAIRVFTPLLLAEIIVLLLYALRWYLDRRRFARWDCEWCLIGPRYPA